RPARGAVDDAAERDFTLVQELVGAVRQIRAEYGVEPGKPVNVRASRAHPAFRAEEQTIMRLAKIGSLTYGPPLAEAGANAVLVDGTTLYIALGDLVDVKKECQRLGAELERITGLIGAQQTKLGNEQFVSRAPAPVVEGERAKLAQFEQQAAALTEKRGQLGC
ncbi:MAG: valine--tRNA ligase, partial [Gemmatimonadota bacterium]|nr:valine--tRNA ligase [Gemmatimonadota bacterium]